MREMVDFDFFVLYLKVTMMGWIENLGFLGSLLVFESDDGMIWKLVSYDRYSQISSPTTAFCEVEVKMMGGFENLVFSVVFSDSIQVDRLSIWITKKCVFASYAIRVAAGMPSKKELLKSTPTSLMSGHNYGRIQALTIKALLYISHH